MLTFRKVTNMKMVTSISKSFADLDLVLLHTCMMNGHDADCIWLLIPFHGRSVTF